VNEQTHWVMVNAFEWCRDKTDSTIGHTDDD
jgi:hypothetical protein